MITNINQLNPYNTNATIKARVAFKSAVKTYSNQKGEGKLFNVELVDSSGEIKCTMFNEVVDMFEHVFQVDKVYYISKASVKPGMFLREQVLTTTGNPRFTKAEFEMSLNKGSTVEEVFDTDDLPKIRYDFLQSIDQIQDIPTGNLVGLYVLSCYSLLDVLGVISSCTDVVNLTSKKDGRELNKRSLHIIDHSGRSVELTLWGEQAVNFAGSVGAAVALKNARIGEYQNAKTLSTISSTQIDINPALEAAEELLRWSSKFKLFLLLGLLRTLTPSCPRLRASALLHVQTTLRPTRLQLLQKFNNLLNKRRLKVTTSLFFVR